MFLLLANGLLSLCPLHDIVFLLDKESVPLNIQHCICSFKGKYSKGSK